MVTNKDIDSSIVTMRADGTNKKVVYKAVDGVAFAPSWSPNDEWITFGFGSFLEGRRNNPAKIIMVRRDGTEAQDLTSGMPNAGFPSWSPDGSRILFTRKQDENFDIFTINPDGTEVRRMTTFPANDARAVWTQDGKYILWNSGEYGFKDEAALYDNSFQPYGSIWIMNADGSGKRQLTDSHREDAMPAFVPNTITAKVAK